MVNVDKDWDFALIDSPNNTTRNDDIRNRDSVIHRRSSRLRRAPDRYHDKY